MRNLEGMEMVCFCKTKHFDLDYQGGGVYLDPKGDRITDLMDMNCYVCTASFFTREGDYIDYCPNCGNFERKRFNEKEELVTALRANDFAWLKRTNGLKTMMVQTFDGDWQLRFAKTPVELDQSGRYKKVVPY